MFEQWQKWIPVENLSNKYYLKNIIDIQDFKIILSDMQNSKIEVFFENSVFSYKRSIGSFSEELINDISEKYGTEFIKNWTFFKVSNSEYIKWLSEQSLGISIPYELKHFSFICSNCILDIASTYEPEVRTIL